MPKHRFTLKELKEMSDLEILRILVNERKSDLNGMTHVYERFNKISARLDDLIQEDQMIKEMVKEYNQPDVPQYKRERMEKAEELVKQFESYVNTMSLDAKPFIAEMCKIHRTNQNSFASLVLQWFAFAATSDYRTDLRNEQVRKIGMLIKKAWETEYGTPFTGQLYMV